jgi:hypothetical protein
MGCGGFEVLIVLFDQAINESREAVAETALFRPEQTLLKDRWIKRDTALFRGSSHWVLLIHNG